MRHTYPTVVGTPVPQHGTTCLPGCLAVHAHIDVTIANHGSIFVFTPLTDAAVDWFDEHVASEPWQWQGPGIGIGVDHRLAFPLANALRSAGLELQ